MINTIIGLFEYVVKSEKRGGKKRFTYPRPSALKHAVAWLGEETTFAIFLKGYDVVIQNHFRPLWVDGKDLDITWKPGDAVKRGPIDKRKVSRDFIEQSAIDMSEAEFCKMLMDDMGIDMDTARAIRERKLANINA